MEVNSDILNGIIQWTWKHLISLAAFIISFFSYLKSKAANHISEEANKIAQEANQLVKVGMLYDKEKDKENLINEIIKNVVANWTKNGGAIANLLTEWNIHNKKLTDYDFENIWKFAYQRVKGREPKQSFQDLLNKSNKTD
ncbi:hypothetical protein SC657_08595 [Legionella pneumophila]